MEQKILYESPYNNDLPAAAINDFPVFFVFWNFFLLLIPLILCGLIIRIWQRKKQKNFPVILTLAVIWLVFLPNAPYIITDLRHISGYCGFSYLRICVENGWMPIFFFAYSALGWIGFVYALKQMKIFLSSVFGNITAQAIIIFLMPVIALGLLLGLLNRFNSWDIISSPVKVMQSALLYASDWFYFRNWILYTIIMYALYFAGCGLFSEKTFFKAMRFFNGENNKKDI